MKTHHSKRFGDVKVTVRMDDADMSSGIVIRAAYKGNRVVRWLSAKDVMSKPDPALYVDSECADLAREMNELAREAAERLQ